MPSKAGYFFSTRKMARKMKEMLKKGRELSRFAAPAAGLRFSHVDWMQGRKSSPRASSSRTCSYIAALVGENEIMTAGDRVCPTNRKPCRKVKKRKKRGGALAHIMREKRTSNNALRRFYAHMGARYANCFRPGRTLPCTLCATRAIRDASRRVHGFIYGARRCSTQGNFSPDDWL